MGLGSAGSRPADLGSRGAYAIDSAADRLPSREAENSPRLWPGVAHGRSPDLYEDAVRQDMARPFGVVNDEDEFTVQLSCSWATAKGSVEYQACVSHYLDEILAGANYPAVAPTDDYQTTMAQLACEPLRLEGPAVYNGCLHKYLGDQSEIRETRMAIGTESGRAAVSHPDR